jgi:HlyD family secretion protein
MIDDPRIQSRRPANFPFSPITESTGEGVDRKITKKRWSPKRIAIAGVSSLAVVALALIVWNTSSGGRTLNVDGARLTVSEVRVGPFQEFIAVTATALPLRTIFLDAIEGGRIEDVYAREGELVVVDQPLLRLTNSELQLRLMGSEAQLAEQMSNLQQMRFQMEQNRLNLRQQIAQMEYDIVRLNREHDRNSQLYERNLISAADFERVRDELDYLQRRRRLTLQSFEQDSLSQETRISQMESSVNRLRQNFSILQDNLENLTVRAPVAGRLTALDAEVGEIRPSGSRFGQIDVLDGYRVRAQIDEYYIERIHYGQRAVTQPIGGEVHALTVQRVYPEVRDGRFEVDMMFNADDPDGLRRGQTIRVRLELGDSEEATLVRRGGFYQSTGGNWAFVLSRDGTEALRRPIRIGRQNPEHFEVLSGLEPGERVIVSSYETFGNADRLVVR